MFTGWWLWWLFSAEIPILHPVETRGIGNYPCQWRDAILTLCHNVGWWLWYWVLYNGWYEVSNSFTTFIAATHQNRLKYVEIVILVLSKSTREKIGDFCSPKRVGILDCGTHNVWHLWYSNLVLRVASRGCFCFSYICSITADFMAVLQRPACPLGAFGTSATLSHVFDALNHVHQEYSGERRFYSWPRNTILHDNMVFLHESGTIAYDCWTLMCLKIKR